MWTLADPAVEWVHHEPSQPGQACLICDSDERYCETAARRLAQGVLL